MEYFAREERMARHRAKRGAPVPLPESQGDIGNVYVPWSFEPAHRQKPPRTRGPRSWDVCDRDGKVMYTVRGSDEVNVMRLVLRCEKDPLSFFLRENKPNRFRLGR